MNTNHLDELCAVLLRVKRRDEMVLLLRDLLTPKELETIAQRVQLVKGLIKGTPQRQISSNLKISIAKVTRGSLALKRSRGGFRRFLGE